jgi:hypothetical protein
LKFMGVKLGHIRKLQKALEMRSNAPSALVQRVPSNIRVAYNRIPTTTVNKRTVGKLIDILGTHADPASTHLIHLKNKRSTKPKKDVHAPEKPLNAYLLFIAQQREIMQMELGHDAKLKMTDYSSQWGQAWRNMSAEERAPFENDAKHRKLLYKRALEEYKTTSAYANYVKYLENWHKQSKSTPQQRSDATLQSIMSAEPGTVQAVLQKADATVLSDALLSLLEDGASSEDAKRVMISALLQHLPDNHNLHNLVRQSRIPVSQASDPIAQSVSEQVEPSSLTSESERERSVSAAPTVSPSISSTSTLKEKPVTRTGKPICQPSEQSIVKAPSLFQSKFCVAQIKAPSLLHNLPPMYPTSFASDGESDDWESDGINEPY